MLSIYHLLHFTDIRFSTMQVVRVPLERLILSILLVFSYTWSCISMLIITEHIFQLVSLTICYNLKPPVCIPIYEKTVPVLSLISLIRIRTKILVASPVTYYYALNLSISFSLFYCFEELN